jgi:SAM-dependent methyltransferase
MITIAFAFLTLGVLLFGFVVLFGAPYVPTLKPQADTAFSLLNLEPGQTLVELGCGDGRVLIAAAKKEIYVVGYELNPLLAIVCWARTRRYKKYVKVVWGNFWNHEWPAADAIFVFLLDKYMEKLDKKITQKYNGKKVKLVSFAFQIPGKRPVLVKNGLFLYQY